MVSSPEKTLHLVCPRATAWESVFSVFARSLNIPIISYEEWSSRLDEASDTLGRSNFNGALSLVHFFRTFSTQPSLTISTAKSCEVSPTLGAMVPVNTELTEKSVTYWRKIGFLN